MLLGGPARKGKAQSYAHTVGPRNPHNLPAGSRKVIPPMGFPRAGTKCRGLNLNCSAEFTPEWFDSDSLHFYYLPQTR
jgi:hypothetical protein